MSLLAFYGFDQCNMAVAADGSSPVDGTGPDSWSYTSVSTTNAAPAIEYDKTAGFSIGVVSDTTQAMGKAPKRQPLVIQSSSAAVGGTWPIKIGIIRNDAYAGTNVYGGLIVGMRMKFTASASATLATANAPVIRYGAAGMGGGFQRWVGAISYNASTQTLSISGGSIAMPLGQEFYIELAATGTDGGTVQAYVNGQAFGNPIGVINQFVIAQLTTASLVTGSADWFRMSICDIYVSNLYGVAPYNTVLGDCKVLTNRFDNITANTFTPTPSTVTAEEAIANYGDNETLASVSGGSAVTMGLSEAPTGLDSQVIAYQSLMSFSKDTTYTGAVAWNFGANGTAGPTSTVTLGASEVSVNSGPRGVLPDGTPVTPSNIGDITLTATAT